MPKAKLTDAVKQAKAAADVAAKTEAEKADSGKPKAENADGDADGEDTADDADGDSDDADDDAADDADDSESDDDSEETEAAAKSVEVNSLANFRTVFGVEKGSVFFADKVDFSQACVKHISELNATLAAKDKKIAELEATAKSLAGSVLGEADPVKVKQGDAADTSTPRGKRDAYATHLEQKLNGLKA